MLACDLPLVFKRDLESATGDLITVTFVYEKLKKFCTRCFHLTHDENFCPYRKVSRQQPRYQNCRHDREDGRNHKSSHYGDDNRHGSKLLIQAKPTDRDQGHGGDNNRDHELISSYKLVRRELFAVVEADKSSSEKKSMGESTKEWVQKSFSKE